MTKTKTNNPMKKIIAILAFFSLAVVFSGCTDEEIKPKTDAASGRTETNNAKWDWVMKKYPIVLLVAVAIVIGGFASYPSKKQGKTDALTSTQSKPTQKGYAESNPNKW